MRAAFEAGATAYVLKQSPPEQIIAAMDAAMSGALWVGAGVPRPGFGHPMAVPAEFPGLTPREAAIADLMSRGLGNPVIAERLGLSPETVANYVSLILVKLGAEDRHDAAPMVRSLREQQG